MSAANPNEHPVPETGAMKALHDAPRRAAGLPDDGPSPMQVSLLRGKTGQQRLKLAEVLYWEARKLKAAGVRHQHPDWLEERVTAEVNRIFLNARS